MKLISSTPPIQAALQVPQRLAAYELADVAHSALIIRHIIGNITLTETNGQPPPQWVELNNWYERSGVYADHQLCVMTTDPGSAREWHPAVQVTELSGCS